MVGINVADLPAPQAGGARLVSGRVVGVEQGEGEQRIIGVSFHPELTGDTTIHRDLPD